MKNLYIIFACFLIISCGKPIAEFALQVDKKTAPAKVQFENKSSKADSFSWDFGDGIKSNESNPTHLFSQSGNYTILLKACKGSKCVMKTEKLHIDAPHECMILLETPYGNMEIMLYNQTPLHRDNFIKLAEEGYFNDLLFHRVINGFMIQGGDPNSRDADAGTQLGSGGPGYTIPAEFVDTLVHIKGALAAARTGDGMNPKKASSGSQFYIVQGRPIMDAQLDALEGQKNIRYTTEARTILKTDGGTPFLDKEYTVFGRVVKGLDVIDKIAAAPTLSGDRPRDDVKMKVKVIK
jgi:cyclophilin family peptidyl-prolyl cis-trans isomerase